MSSCDDKPEEFSEWVEQEGNTSPYFHHSIQPENSRYFSDWLINVMGKNTAVDQQIYKVCSLVGLNIYAFPVEGHPLTCCVSETLAGKQRGEAEPGGLPGTQRG